MPVGTPGNLVNQVQRGFNGLGQLTNEWQSHSGAVITGTTPQVQYAYSEMAGGANNSRLTSMTYPNGKVLNYNYATGLDSNISRLTSLSDNSGTLESYSYLGLDTVVQRARSQISTNLTYIKQTGDSNGDAGDQYIGLDRFGRVVDQRWLNTGTLAATDRFQYGYDRDSNALYRNNLVNTAFGELYHASGAGNGYDNLNQLSGFLRGVLSASGGPGTPLDTISSPTTTESWSPDAMGNFSSVTTNGNTQTRTHNQQNEITSISSLTTPTYDANGNLTKDEQGQTYKYDAWNRLVQVKNSGSTVIAQYAYDGMGRRIQETHSGTANDLYYSAAWQVLEERTGGVSTATVQYVWSPVYVDALVLRDRSTQNNGTLDERLWVQQDANWNLTALVNSSGSVVERYIYDPYGQVTYLNASFGVISVSAFGWVYGYQGLRLDTATGNADERGRQYRATLGRFLQNDPLGIGGGDTNFYRAIGNSPANSTDPSGLDDHWVYAPWRTTKLIWNTYKPWSDELSLSELKKPTLEHQGLNDVDLANKHATCAGDIPAASDPERTQGQALGDSSRLILKMPGEVAGTMILVGGTFFAPEDAIFTGLMEAKGLVAVTIKGKRVLNSVKLGRALTREEAELLAAEYNLAKAGKGVVGQIKHQTHHIAPWEGAKGARFRELFESVGSCAETDPFNKMQLPGHAGSHINEYHDYVYERLEGAIRGKSGQKAKDAFYIELEKIKQKLIEDPRLPYADGSLRK